MNNMYTYHLSNSPVGDPAKTKLVKVIDLLPSLSAQACPITIIKENASALTKRASYSADLKDKASFQVPKYTSSFSFHHRSRCSTDNGLPHKSDNGLVVANETDEATIESLRSLTLDAIGQDHRDTTNAIKSNLFTEEDILKDSFKDCNQIFMKIQRKLSNKISKTSTKTSTIDGMSCEELLQKPKKYATFFRHKPTKQDHKNRRKTKPNMEVCKTCVKKKDEQPEERNIQKIINAINRDVNQIQQRNILKKTTQEIYGDNNPVNKAPAKKVYYSDRQSDNIGDVPCVPPCTPNDRLLNGIASLSDIKSQRNIQHKLQEIKNRQLKKEKEILKHAKLKEAHAKVEQANSLMEKQRRQIYAINKLLADVEHENFLKYKEETLGVPV